MILIGIDWNSVRRPILMKRIKKKAYACQMDTNSMVYTTGNFPLFCFICFVRFVMSFAFKSRFLLLSLCCFGWGSWNLIYCYLKSLYSKFVGIDFCFYFIFQFSREFISLFFICPHCSHLFSLFS